MEQIQQAEKALLEEDKRKQFEEEEKRMKRLDRLERRQRQEQYRFTQGLHSK